MEEHHIQTIERLSRPERFCELADILLSEQNASNGQAFFDCIDLFRDWGVTGSESVVRFMQQREWNWRGPRVPLADW
jgi:hypothetical protein